MLFDESSGSGLSERLNAFWNAWGDLSNQPAGAVERSQLLARSRELVSLFNETASNLSQVQRQADDTIENTIAEINTITGQLAELNGRIRQGDLAGSETNTLKDARLALLKELSEKIDITSYQHEDGTLSVALSTGNPMVESTSSMLLGTVPGAGPFQDAIVWLDGQGNTTTITDQIAGGELKGWLEVRDQIIPDIMTRLDTLANTMITEVNLTHQAGLALDNTQNDFFTGTSASDMAVNTVILNDPDKIAAAGSTESIPNGNGTALAISALQSAALMNGGTANIGQYYTSLVSDIGSDLQTASLNADHQNDVSINLTAYRESISGVSLDEEMVRLIQYQHAFEAAAQLINVADEMLETVLQII
jgi:flagellar hook-associated protein 1 FlgK